MSGTTPGFSGKTARMYPLSEILCETLTRLTADPGLTGRELRAIHLGYYFTVVALDDHSVGACMSYYDAPPEKLREAEERLARISCVDPLLVRYLLRAEPDEHLAGLPPTQGRGVLTSILGAVVSALSAKSVAAGGDGSFLATTEIPFDPFAGVRSAVIIGYGGYLREVIERDEIRQVHISDLNHGILAMRARLRAFGKRAFTKLITLSDGTETEERLGNADVACITGSALCNGTMEHVLRAARYCPRVIVQGQSASIHPQSLFERGVQLVTTTLKPYSLVAAASEDRGGALLRASLESGLPWVYMIPK